MDLANVLDQLDEPAPARPGRAAKPSKPDRAAQERDAKVATSRTASASTAKDKDKGKKPVPPPQPKDPSRVWVQVAGGANESTLPRAFAAVKTKAPKLLGSRTAWTVPNRASNRILVGPFASEDEAQEFVNKLAKSDVSAFTFTSEKGQKIEKLPAK